MWLFNVKKYLSVAFSLLFLAGFSQGQKFTVVVDPGHGGSDTGAMRRYSDLGLVKEAHVALQIGLKLEKMLKKRNDIKVIMTRTSAVYPSLSNRTDLANNSHANLFISIHLNSTGSNRTQATGTETFVQGPNQNQANLEVAKRENSVIYLDKEDRRRFEHYNPDSPESLIALKIQQAKYLQRSLLLGSLIQKNFENNHRVNRGVKQRNLHVLRENAMPAVLIETGFVNNYDDAKYLASDKGQTEVAKAIYDAVVKYKKELTGNRWVPKKPEPPKEIRLHTDFRILLMTSPKRYLEGDPALRGLKYILRIKEGNLYYYYYATTNIASVRNENLKHAKDAGFKHATAVPFIPDTKLKKGYYTIEVAVTDRKLTHRSYIMKTLGDGLHRRKDNGINYYTYGKVNTLEAAVKMQKQIEGRGIKNTTIEKVDN